MSHDEHVIGFAKTLAGEIAILQQFIPLLIPANDDDAKVIEIGLDMLDCLYKDLSSGDTPYSEIFDMELVKEEYPEIKSKLIDDTSSEVMHLIDFVMERYRCDGDSDD